MASDLPEDILHLIMGKLSSMVCHAAFRSVCQSWRSFSLRYYSHLVPPPPPWLMFPDKPTNPNSRLYHLYNFDGTKRFFQFETPEGCGHRSYSGTWLVFWDRKMRRIRVWNPLSLTHILLPHLMDPSKLRIIKVVVSCTGPLIKNPDDVIFGIIYNYTKFAFTRLGDKGWTFVQVTDSLPLHQTPKESIKMRGFNDIIFHKGKLYVVNEFGMVFVCEEGIGAPHRYTHDYDHLRIVKAKMFIDNSYKMKELNPMARFIFHYLGEVSKFSIRIVVRRMAWLTSDEFEYLWESVNPKTHILPTAKFD
ncbi:hypothetical protein Sjap_001405 [Stephania japonica]|uniref:F-box domain-containing protein n=1 Tax=Stephania japonica TaxID=461633 RepID=A0AAP0PT99_9MAGN